MGLGVHGPNGFNAISPTQKNESSPMETIVNVVKGTATAPPPKMAASNVRGVAWRSPTAPSMEAGPSGLIGQAAVRPATLAWKHAEERVETPPLLLEGVSVWGVTSIPNIAVICLLAIMQFQLFPLIVKKTCKLDCGVNGGRGLLVQLIVGVASGHVTENALCPGKNSTALFLKFLLANISHLRF